MAGALAGGSACGDGRLGPSPRAESRISGGLCDLTSVGMTPPSWPWGEVAGPIIPLPGDIPSPPHFSAVDELVNRIATSSGDSDEWWNASTHEELGGRTPTEAWLAGDHDGVMRVVAGWYQQSDERAEQIRNDPAMFEMIKDRRRSIAEKADHRRSA